MSENTRDAVRAIAAADGRARDNLIHEFMRSRMGLFNRIGWSLCRNFGVNPAQHGEDFASMVSQEAYVMLTEQIADDEALEQVHVWEAMLKLRSKQLVRNFLDKDMAPATEMSSTFRRVRMLNQTRDEMRLSLSREPTDDEVVKEHNTRMYANRSNPVKQGVLATVDDLSVYRATADVDNHDYEQPIDTEFVHPVEARSLPGSKDQRDNERFGEAAELWLSGLYSAAAKSGHRRRSPKPWRLKPRPGPTSANQGTRRRRRLRSIRNHRRRPVAGGGAPVTEVHA
jgi:hypothetical protein